MDFLGASSMSEMVWVSTAMTDPRLEFPLTNEILESDRDQAIEISNIVKNGGSLSAELCPNRIWYKPVKGERKIPDFFRANTHYIVTERVANILRQFDLGGGALYPVNDGIYKKDNKTRFPGEYFTWIFGNVKTGFLGQHSPTAEERGGSSNRDWCKFPTYVKDNDIAVSRDVLGGPDIWLDHTLFQSIFLSGRLADALIEAGLKRAFQLYQCRVI
jgi:hypothetical protein